MQSQQLADLVYDALDDLKANAIKTLDVRHLTSVTDFMIIASGRSDRHVRALADAVLERCKAAGCAALGVEGQTTGEWVLLDLGDVVVHVMLPRVRDFYNLEKLWEIENRDRTAQRGRRSPLMHIHILAVSNRPPAWVAQGCEDYLKRLPGAARPRIQRLPLARRRRGAGTSHARDEEGARMLAVLPDRAHVVALDVAGSAWTTAELSERLMGWQRGRQDVYLLVGGPDGLAPACLERATERWSLSSLTLPHALVQVVLAEALYRAWTVNQGHPYHR